MRAERGMQAARGATASVCGHDGEHKGQGLALRFGGEEETVVLTCHHVVAAVEREHLHVRLPCPDGTLGAPVEAAYDGERSCPEKDAAVLRVREDASPFAFAMPLLHKLGADMYEGNLEATVLTCLTPDNFDATVRPSTPIDVCADPHADWPDTPDRYRLRVFRLAETTYSKPGFSGGVVVCEGGVLGLAHFGRGEGEHAAREAYLVPLSVWSERWPALEDLIVPLVDGNLRGAATVKLGADLSVGLGADVVVANHRPEVYAYREVDDLAQRAIDEHGGVIMVGRPLSGKSRLAVELLRRHPRSTVVVPRPHSPAPPEGFEASGFAGEEVILFFDDLHRTAGTAQTLAWRSAFKGATGRPCKVICASRDGGEWRQVETDQGRLLQELDEGAMVFTSRVGEPSRQEGEDLSLEQGRELAEELGMGATEFGRRFDGTPGSLLLDLDDMRRRYEALRDEHRGGVPMGRLLDSAKLLYRARLPTLPHPLVRSVAERVRGSAPIDQETWEALIRRTRDEGFADVDEDSGDIRYYSPYLERCVLYEPAREDLERLSPLMEEARDFVGLFYLVACYGHDLKEYERALALAERAIELDPSFAPSWYNKSYSLDHLGRNEEALEAIDRALQLDRGYHPAYYSKGWALSHLGRHEEAVAAFREALRLGSATHPGTISMYLHGLAHALAERGRFYDALSAGMQAIHLHPPYPHTPRFLCKLLLTAGLGRFALEVFESLLRQDPSWTEAWCAKGHALSEMGRQKEALACYEEALDLDPDLAEAWAGKGMSLLTMSDSVVGSDRLAKFLRKDGAEEVAETLAASSLEAFDRAIALDDAPDNRSNKALALSRLARDEEALQLLNDALELEPTIPLIVHNRGMVHLKMRRYDEALEDFEAAVRLLPSLARAWWGMVLAARQLGRMSQALAAVEVLILLNPGNAGYWFAKGCILTKLGRPDLGGFWLRCARSHETLKRWYLAGSPEGKRRSLFDFAGPERPEADGRYRAIGSAHENPMRTMRKRFREVLGTEQQDVLRALKLLVFAGVGSLTHRRLRAALASEHLLGREGTDLKGVLETLAQNAFLDLPIDQDPVVPEFACLWDAVSYRSDRRVEEDLDELANVLQDDLNDHEGLANLSGTYAQKFQDYDSALDCADRALALDPDHAPAWSNRSSALRYVGRYGEALEAAEEAARLAPGHPNALHGKGVALSKLGRHAEALSVFDEMLESWHDDPSALVGRAEALAGLGREGEGAEELARAVGLHPGDLNLVLHEGFVLLENGEQEGALRAAERALNVRPDEHRALFLKATTFLAMEREGDAAEWFLRAWSVRNRFPDGGAMVADMLRSLGHNPASHTLQS